MSFHMEVSFQGFEGELLTPEQKHLLMTLFGYACLDIMRIRTYEGNDWRGAPFERYTKQYERYKERRGRQPYTRGDWLKLSGGMLDAWDVVEDSPEHFVVGFGQGRNALVAVSNVQKREFVGMTEAEKQEARAWVMQQIDEMGWEGVKSVLAMRRRRK